MLVAAPERWDEACFAIPAVRAIQASGLSVGVVCREEQQELWHTLPGLEVIGFSPKTKAKQLAAQLGADWQASLVWEAGTVADAASLAGVSRRLGQDDRKLKKRLTHTLGFFAGPLEHRVRFYLSAVEEMGIHTTKPEFFAPACIGIPPVNHAVLLSPDSDFGPSYEWSLDGWFETAGNLIEKGFRVTVAGVDGGRGLGETLAGKLGDAVEFFHASPLAGALPLLAVHGLCVAADGSLPHLAAHVGATCVTLFGPNDPAWKRPLGRRHAVVCRHVECAPCLLAKCPLDRRCQNELTQERVWSAVLEKLD
jgi:ADP-heptose:LPS heptosyltransferase